MTSFADGITERPIDYFERDETALWSMRMCDERMSRPSSPLTWGRVNYDAVFSERPVVERKYSVVG